MIARSVRQRKAVTRRSAGAPCVRGWRWHKRTMRLNVISLPAREDRRAQFMAWNARPGIEINWVSAAIGADLDRGELIAQSIITSDNASFGAGALGCAVSHRALWLAARQAHTPTLICEDDACLRGDFVQQAEATLAQLPADWHLCYLGYNTDSVVATQSEDGLKALLFFDETAKRAPGFFDSFARLNAPTPTPLQCYQVWGNLCYVVSPAGAQRLLELCFPMRADIEVFMFGQNRKLKPFGIDGIVNVALQRAPLNAYCLVPPLAVGPNDGATSDVVVR